MYPSSYIKDKNRSYLHFQKTYGHHTWQTWPFGHVASWSHVTNKKRYISASTSLWLRKLTRWMFIVKGHHPLSLLMLWSRDQVITWQMENVISQLLRDLWLPKLTEWWVLMRAYYLPSLITCWSRGHIRSHDKWKNVTNSLSRDLSLSKLAEGWLMIRSHMSNHKATYSFDHVVTWVSCCY